MITFNTDVFQKQRIRDVIDPGKSLGHSDKAS
jgi:predicted Rdx family selenoprotein